MRSIDPDLVLPLVGAIVAGALVGLERQYRGSPAGFRTHVLVSLASALLMLSAVHQVRWLSDTPYEIIRIDPVRMAHGILTGIGFLGAGAIFREGLTIRGLTTAASLWITSALGTLFGVGFYGLAIGGTVATVILLAAVGVTEALLPQRAFVDIAVRYPRAAEVDEAAFRATLAGFGLGPAVVNSSVEDDVVEFSATVRAAKDFDTNRLGKGLLEDRRAIGFKIRPYV
jgi:putative Mg2+ transporter-C (MgtC) family protein